MNLGRFLDEGRIDLDLDALIRDAAASDADPDAGPPVSHEALVRHMATLLVTSDEVVNATRLENDLVLRERREATLLGQGVAMPHVRTLQARKLIIAVGISHAGLAIPGTPDGEPVRLVISFVGPTYDDKVYLLAYRRLGERLQEEWWVQSMLEAESPGEIVRALSS